MITQISMPMIGSSASTMIHPAVLAVVPPSLPFVRSIASNRPIPLLVSTIPSDPLSDPVQPGTTAPRLKGVGTWIYALAASVWMPGNVSNQWAEFGAFGIAMAIVT